MKPFAIIMIFVILIMGCYAGPETEQPPATTLESFLTDWLHFTVPQNSKIQPKLEVIDKNTSKNEEHWRKTTVKPGSDDQITQQRVHVVSRGETLSAISQRYGISLTKLKQYNQLNNANKIYTGQQLLMEAPQFFHTIRKGDTLWQLAQTYNCSVNELLQANPTVAAYRLMVGSKLTIPQTAAPVISFSWPVIGKITSPFGYRSGSWHRGLDIGAKEATVIRASASGQVISAKWNGYYGLCVLIQHGQSFQTRYAHASKLLVKQNQWVSAGEAIALVGSTGKSTGPHLHFEIIKNNEHQNPISFLP